MFYAFCDILINLKDKKFTNSVAGIFLLYSISVLVGGLAH